MNCRVKSKIYDIRGQTTLDQKIQKIKRKKHQP